MYIIMYKYSAFKINRKYFRSGMSKNFSSFPARPGIPCHPEPVLLVILSASEGSSPTDFSIIISKHTKI